MKYMTDKEIKRLVNKLNKGVKTDLIQRRALAETVEFAKVWMKRPDPKDDISNRWGPSEFYLIKNKDGTYVSAVLVMLNNLHWYVLNQYRGKGFLSKALRETILYHLLQQKREGISISIDKSVIGEKNYISSERVALKVGFTKQDVKPNSASEYFLNPKSYKSIMKYL